MPKKETLVKNITIYASYLLLIWGCYRLLFKLPDEVEEVFIKPFIWLLPIFYLLKVEKAKLSSLGLTFKNIFPALYFSLGLGSFFVLEALIVNYLKYGGFHFAANLGEGAILTSLGLSFATAISEEVSFRGYIFNRLWKIFKKELPANLITTAVWVLIHVPITFFVWKLPLVDTLIYLFLTTLFGAGSSFIFARTQNVVSSILLHVLWEWPIILFR